MKRKIRKNIKAFSLPCILFAGIFSFDVALNAQVALQKQPLFDNKQQDYAVNAIPPEYLNCDKNCIYGLAKGITVDKIRQEGYTTLQIPDYVTKIADNAFFNMFDGLSTRVDTLLLGKELKIIGDNAFWGCTGFSNTIDFSKSKTEQIGTSAFEDCTNIPNINFLHNESADNTLRSLGERCFANCEKLTKIVLPDSLQDIQNYAFDNCNHVNEIDLTMYKSIPSWVVNNLSIFRNCGRRSKEDNRNIFVNLKGGSLTDWDELLKNQREKESQLIVAPSNITTVTGDDAFVVNEEEWNVNGNNKKLKTYRVRDDFDWSNIYTIYVPKEAEAFVLKWGSGMNHPINLEFEADSQLQVLSGAGNFISGELKLPDSLQLIDFYCFENSKIRKVTLPNNKTWTIAGGAFRESSLVELVIPPLALSNTNTCSGGTFSECSHLSFIDCQLPTDLSTIPWKKATETAKWFSGVNSRGTIIIPKVGLTEEQDKARLQEFENQMISNGFPENSLYDAYTQEPKPENKWLVASYENNVFPNESFLMNQKDEMYKVSDDFDAKKNEYGVLQLPENTKIVKSGVFKEHLGSKDLDDGKTWAFRPNFGLTTIQNEAFANNSYSSPLCKNGLLINNTLPNTVSKMDNPFGNNYNIRGYFAIPESVSELTNFSIANTNITDLALSPTLKVFTANTKDESFAPFKSQTLQNIDLTAFKSVDDFKKVNWDPHVFDLETWDMQTGHYIYLSEPPEGMDDVLWEEEVTMWIVKMRAKIGLPPDIASIGWRIYSPRPR